MHFLVLEQLGLKLVLLGLQGLRLASELSGVGPLLLHFREELVLHSLELITIVNQALL